MTFATYDDLWRWSVDDPAGFWQAIWDFFGVQSKTTPTSVMMGNDISAITWFDGALLNYAEHALLATGPAPAIIGRSDSRGDSVLSRDDLRDEVARVRAGLVRLGVGRGDRVASYLPNIPETVVAFLATASLGAIWTSCAPEFGAGAVIDRWSQVTPKVVFAVAGYRYGERSVSKAADLERIVASLGSVECVVMVPYGDTGHDDVSLPSSVSLTSWDSIVAEDGPLVFSPVPFSHPLYVLYSSGTTGIPKAIVHCHGGILIEHLKVLGLHADLSEDDRFLWFTTTGWMMWNYLVSGLLHGSTIVTVDVDPGSDGPRTLWRVAADLDVTWLGLGAPYITAGAREHIRPGEEFDLRRLRSVGSTGSPLPAAAFRWVYEAVGRDLHLSSISGGTDICSAFVGGDPAVPVWAGEISCRYLGAAVEAFDADGRPVVGEQGELVVTGPMPSMPVGFWGDTDGSRFRAAYFDRFPGVWTHGDWITITDRGSCVISGRSDATLNRAGIRVGTAEIYAALDGVAGVVDSVIVHLDDDDGIGTLVLLVAIRPDSDGEVDPQSLIAMIRETIRREISPRHVPDEVHLVDAIPRTLSGKKPEVPIKRILMGEDPDSVISRESLEDPTALESIVTLASRR